MSRDLTSIAAILIVVGGVVPMTVALTVACTLSLQKRKDKIDAWFRGES